MSSSASWEFEQIVFDFAPNITWDSFSGEQGIDWHLVAHVAHALRVSSISYTVTQRRRLLLTRRRVTTLRKLNERDTTKTQSALLCVVGRCAENRILCVVGRCAENRN